MAKQKKSFFQSKGFKVLMSRIYGIGAAVVIIGALFKILHWQFANEFLMAGLFTEAAIFFISAFEPVKAEYDWSRVYPELGEAEVVVDPKTGKKAPSLVKSLDEKLAEAQLEQNTLNRLSSSFKALNENVTKLTQVGDAAAATDDYARSIKQAASSVSQLNESYAHAISAIEQIGSSGDVSREYYDQVQQVTQKLASLNSIYEVELNESSNHINQLNKFLGGLNKAVENVSESEESTAHMRQNFARLNQNLNNLNTVYGNMLSAMSAGANQAR